MRLEDAQSVLDKVRAIELLLRDRILDVAPTQALMLAYFDGPCPAGRIKHWGTNPSYNLTNLCAHGYLKKVEDGGDERRTIIHITAKGAALAAEVRRVIVDEAPL